MKYILATLSLLAFLYSNALAAERSSSFDLGRRQFESGNYERALDLFSQTISRAPDASTKNKAYYFQGLSLFEMGLYYSSFISFRNVLLTADDKNREVYEKAIKNAVIITDRLNMVERVGKLLQKLPGAYIPNSVAGTAHYAQGVYEFSVNNNEAAMSHLKSVNPENQYYDKALLHLGIIATKKKDYREAAFYFEKLLDVTRGKRELFPLAELARLNLARTVYSAGEMEKSIELYSQFLSSSPYWLTVLQEASWPLMRVNDTTVSLGNLHTVLSPFYREDLVGESYILRATILYSLCKYEEMRRTLGQFFTLYDPVIRAMQQENGNLNSVEAYYRAFASQKGLHRGFLNYTRRDAGLTRDMKVLKMLRAERVNVARFSRNEQMAQMARLIDEAEKNLENEIGGVLQKMHRRKLAELLEQREQANYLKVEIVTGEKELIEGQKGLPPKRITDVETSVAAGYHFWPYTGEYWEDELGTYVYTTESACVN